MRSQTIPQAGFSSMALAGALALLAQVGSVRAQSTNGTVNFCNNRSNLVVFLQGTNPVTASSAIKAALYWAPMGSNGFVMLGAAATVGVPLPGVFAGGTRTAGPGTAGGAVGQFKVRAWSGPYATYEQAFTNGGHFSGVSTTITMPTGNPTNAAPTPPASLVAGGFQGFGLGQSPIIIVPPTNQAVGIGRTAVFTVTATGATPLSYQWQFNGTNLTDGIHFTGSLTPVLTILNVQTNDAGSYRVIVTNLYGVTTSPSAVLTMAGLCMPPPAGLIGWWKGDGNGIDSAGGNNAYAMPHIYFTNGIVGQAFACDPGYYYMAVQVADQPAYILTNALTVEAWVRPRGNGAAIFWRGDNRSGYDPYVLTGGNNGFGFFITDPSGNSASVSAPAVYYQWHHVAGTFDAASGKLSLYTNGTLADQITTALRPIGSLLPYGSPGIGIGNVNDGFNNFPYLGDIDEVSLYNRALTAGEIQGLYNAYDAGKCLACPPVITVPPTNQTVALGSNAVFTVLVGGSPTLGYQWTFNGTNSPAATTATLTITNAQLTNVGDYQVIITNAYGSATSSVATLTIGLPPQIIVQPTNQVVLVGSNVVISVTATGTPPLFYQWQFNGTNLTDNTRISGSLTNVLTILNVGPTDAGSYQVLVTNLYGVAVSSNAVLTLAGPCMPPPAGLIGWWKGDGNGIDSAGGNNASAMPNIYFTNGIVGQAFACDPENLPYGTYIGVRVPDVPAYVLTNSLSLEGWIRVRGPGYSVFCRGDDRAGYDPYVMGTGLNNIMGFGIEDANNNYATVTTPLVYNQWYHVAGTLDGDSGKLSLYTNGTLAAQITTPIRPLGDLIPARYPGVGIGNVNDDFNNFPFWGDIDELSLYDRALTAAEIQGVYHAYSSGKCLACPPVITVPPTNQTVVAGSTVALSVLAGGSPALGYQWRFNGTNTLAATTATLTIINAQLANLGDYQVIITNAYGSTSAVATLTVIVPPQILAQPTNQAVLVGSNAAFTVTATGTPSLAYQWRFNGTNLLSATTATLGITNAQLTNAGDYDVVITNNYGRATSAVAYLSVALPPNFQSVSLRAGTLTMTWNGATGFTYQVQYKTNLSQLYWSNLGSTIFATSDIVTSYDAISSDRQRFYRVELLP